MKTIFPKHIRLPFGLCLFLLALFALACGGGGTELASTTIGGTGTGGTTTSKASGPIDQFGSLYVGGIQFNTDGVEPLIEGTEASLTDLELGMWVEVEGTVDASGNTGTATNIIYSAHIAGVVLAINDHELTVNGGNTVTIETDDLTHYGTNITLPISIGNDLVITGQYRSSGNFWASHIGPNTRSLVRARSREALSPSLNEDTEILLHIEMETFLSTDLWEAEGINLDFAGAKNKRNDGSSLQPGQRVMVRGRRDTNGQLRVTEYNLRESLSEETQVSGNIASLFDNPPRVSLGDQIYRIEPFTIFDDQSVDQQRRFGFRELNTGDSVSLTLSSSGVVLKLRKN